MSTANENTVGRKNNEQNNIAILLFSIFIGLVMILGSIFLLNRSGVFSRDNTSDANVYEQGKTFKFGERECSFEVLYTLQAATPIDSGQGVFLYDDEDDLEEPSVVIRCEVRRGAADIFEKESDKFSQSNEYTELVESYLHSDSVEKLSKVYSYQIDLTDEGQNVRSYDMIFKDSDDTVYKLLIPEDNEVSDKYQFKVLETSPQGSDQEVSINSSNAVEKELNTSDKAKQSTIEYFDEDGHEVRKTIDEEGNETVEIITPAPVEEEADTEIAKEEAQPQITEQTYSNQFYPNFRLVYPSDWKFSTYTEKVTYNKLLRRHVTLQKNNSQLTMRLQPKIPAGCGPVFEDTPINYDIPGDYNEYYNEITGKHYYSKEGICSAFVNIINTNIDVDFDPTYNDFYSDESKVQYQLIVETKGNINNFPEAERNEIRKIIENSTFR